MKNTFNKVAVITALFLMVLYLTYVNSKSLLYLVSELQLGFIDQIFSVIGSTALSSVTIIIMRRSRQQWLKIVFPFFDAFLVFCGFNLRFADNLLGNWVAFSLTVFLAVFSGLITYSLGTISYEDSFNSESHNLKSDNEKLVSENEKMKTDIAELATDNKMLISELEKVKIESEKYRIGFYKAERSRILKKSENNRSEREREILAMNLD